MLAGEEAKLYERKNQSGIDVSDPALVEAWEGVKNDERPFAWCSATYAAGGGDRIVLHAKGEGGFAGLVSSFENDSVVYCGLRIRVDGLTKFVFVTWLGPDVSGMRRARVSMHLNALGNFFEGTVAQVLAPLCSPALAQHALTAAAQVLAAVQVLVADREALTRRAACRCSPRTGTSWTRGRWPRPCTSSTAATRSRSRRGCLSTSVSALRAVAQAAQEAAAVAAAAAAGSSRQGGRGRARSSTASSHATTCQRGRPTPTACAQPSQPCWRR
jgi:hypothetical protein